MPAATGNLITNFKSKEMLHKIKLKKYKVLFLALFIHAVSYVATFAQGPGKAIDFAGSNSIEHVNLGLGLSDSLDTSDFTIEMWIKVESTSSDPAFIGNKNWNSGSNTGFVLCRRNANMFRFNFKPSGGSRVDYDVTVGNGIAAWNHFAMVVDRSGNLTAYVNGEQVGTPIDISSDAGKALHGTLPIRIGNDGTGSYSPYFNGKMDEVRIWKSKRTAAEIRQFMCRKLTGNETDLYAYYNMEGTSSTTLANNATATGTTFDGTLQNSPVRVKSGAAIGDTSVYVYANTWTNRSLQLSTANRGTITIDSFSGSGAYMQLYRIVDTPDLKSGLTPSNNNDVYYGIVASGSLVSYPKYDYSNYDSAKAYKEAITFFGRNFDDENSWSIKSVIYNDTTNHVFRTDSIIGTRQLFLANFVGTCNAPTVQSATNITYNSAKLNWNTGGSASWNIEYGPANFTQGNGTTVKNIISKPYALNNLQANTTYQFYVQDSCTGLGTSTWAGPYNFTTDPLPTYHQIGAGAALNITGNNGWVDATGNGGAKDTFTAVNLPVKDITVEVWVNPREFEQWRAMVGFMQDNGNFERGWDLETGNNNKFRFALSSEKTLRLYYMESTSSFDENQWYHVAGVYDGDTTKLYVNGILEAMSTSDSGNIAYDNSWLALGMYKDDNENIPLKGSIDEVRIWNVERSQEEIRETMCRRLNGNETGLVKYFRLDSYEGDTAYDMVTGVHGKLNNLADTNWVVSGAAIGDTSIYVYDGITTASLELNTGNRGKINVDSIMASAEGVQIYLINDTPSYKGGIADVGPTDKYFGVFTARNYSAEYKLSYDYTSYTTAVNNSADLHLYNRRNNQYKMWAITNLGNNTATNTISGKSHLGTRQYILADFVALSCSAPDSLEASNIDTANATIAWVSQENRYSLQWGEVGFQLGDGVTVSGLSAKSFGVTGLSLGTAYEAYVKNDCSGSESAWVGPLYFETINPCVMQTNGFADSIMAISAILKWTDPGAAPAYDISWGPKGFGNPNFGIQVTISDNRYPLGGLQPVTEYDFYVRSNCGANKPGWAGPYTFKTDSISTNSVSSILEDIHAVVYPNPATSTVNIDVNVDDANVYIYNAIGVKVYESRNNSKKISIDVANKPAGMYYIIVEHNGAKATRKLVVRH